MWIDNMIVDIPHPYPSEKSGDDISGDAPQVIFPEDWSTWIKGLESSLKRCGRINLSFSSTSSPGTAAIAIGGDEEHVGPFSLLMSEGAEALCFIVERTTLLQLRGAIDALLAATTIVRAR